MDNVMIIIKILFNILKNHAICWEEPFYKEVKNSFIGWLSLTNMSVEEIVMQLCMSVNEKDFLSVILDNLEG